MAGKQSRYFETAELIDAALLGLLEDKELDFITVKEICARAGVNRSTFYLHYETIDDLLQETAEYLNRHFIQEMSFDSHAVISSIETIPKEQLVLVTPKYLLPYLNYIKQNRRLFETVIKRANALKLHESYQGLLAHVITPILNRFGIPEHDQSYLTAFYLKGLMAIIEDWIRRDCADPIDHIAELMQGALERCIK